MIGATNNRGYFSNLGPIRALASQGPRQTESGAGCPGCHDNAVSRLSCSLRCSSQRPDEGNLCGAQLKRSSGVTAKTHELSKDRRPIGPAEFFPESPQDVSRGEVALLNSKLGARPATARSGAIPDDVHVPVSARDQELVDRCLTTWRC